MSLDQIIALLCMAFGIIIGIIWLPHVDGIRQDRKVQKQISDFDEQDRAVWLEDHPSDAALLDELEDPEEAAKLWAWMEDTATYRVFKLDRQLKRLKKSLLKESK